MHAEPEIGEEIVPPALPVEIPEPMMETPVYPAYAEQAPELSMAASANGAPSAPFDDLETPPILKRDRRFLH
jgi:hypothetical protein